MDLSRIDLNLLVALHALLEERSVRGAARRLSLSPSATSHALTRLRGTLGDELLVRAGAGLVRTPRAEALAPELAVLLAGLSTLLAPTGPVDPSVLRRAFRVMCTDHVTTVLLPDVEAILVREAPGIDLYVAPLHAGTMEDLRIGRLDVAIGVFPEAPAEVRQRRLFVDSFVTVARAGHPRLCGGTLDLEAFLAESHLLVSPRGEPWGTIDDLLQAEGRARRIARTVPSFLAALRFLVETDLLLTVSRRLVTRMSACFSLQSWPTPLPVEDYAIRMAWHPRVDADPEQAWFRGVLSRAAGAMGVG